MQLYRIEHRDVLARDTPFRLGPYGRGKLDRVAPYKSENRTRHPLWEEEMGGFGNGQECYFGFATMKQLKTWFRREDRRIMRRKGYVCRLYEGTGDVSPCQAIMDCSTAREVRTLLSKEWVE